MSWRDRLLPASFRGVPFEVAEAGGRFGRRTVEHVYPQRDRPFVEDMGRAAREIRVVGFVVGDDYFERRDALIAALEAPGPGLLVHPYLGELTVSAPSTDLTESTDEGGIARFSMSFIESGERAFPRVAAADASLVAAAAAEVAATAGAEFVDRWAVAGQPKWTATAATASLRLQVQGMRDALLGPASAAIAEPAALGQQLSALEDDAVSLVFAPVELAASIAAVLDEVGSLRALRLILASAGAADDDTNAEALTRLVMRQALAAAGQAAAVEPFAAYEDAVLVRDELAARADAELELADDADAFEALVELRTLVTRDITRRAADLARLQTITPPEVMTSLVLAHRLYGPDDVATRADELTTRNRLAHPGFVPTRPLLALTR